MPEVMKSLKIRAQALSPFTPASHKRMYSEEPSSRRLNCTVIKTGQRRQTPTLDVLSIASFIHGVTFALFQSAGISPVLSECLKIMTSAGAISFYNSCKTLGPISSGPAAASFLSFRIFFFNSHSVTLIPRISSVSISPAVSSSLVKTGFYVFFRINIQSLCKDFFIRREYRIKVNRAFCWNCLHLPFSSYRQASTVQCRTKRVP